jgi:hypothetical protein
MIWNLTTIGCLFSIVRGVSIGSFFIYKYLLKSCSFEYIHYMAVLVIYSVAELVYANDMSSWMYVIIDGVPPVNVLRPLFWLLQTPIQIKLLYDCLAVDRRNNNTTTHPSLLFEMLMWNQWMIAVGCISFLFPPLGVVYWVTVAISTLCAGFLLMIIWRPFWRFYSKLADMPQQQRQLLWIGIVWFSVEAGVTLIFLLGPESFSVVDQELATGLLQLLYTFGKCIYCVQIWNFVYVSGVKIQTRELEGMGDEMMNRHPTDQQQRITRRSPDKLASI